MTYDEACEFHADRQGLTAIRAALTAAGVSHELYQSGGFTMIVEVSYGDCRFAWITNEGTDDDADYMVGFYVLDREQDVGEPVWWTSFPDTASVVALVAEWHDTDPEEAP